MADSVTNFNAGQANVELTDTQPTPSQTINVELPNGVYPTAADMGDTMDTDDHIINETEEVDYENPETLAIKPVYAYLAEGFTHQVDQLASEFYQASLLESGEHAGSMGMSDSKKAKLLLEIVMSKIRLASNNFDKFVKVLDSHQTFSEIVQKIMERYRELIQAQDPSNDPSHSQFPSRRPPLNKQQSSITSVGAEELQIEIEEIEKRLESVRKGVGRRKGRKERELRLTRQEVTQLKQRLDDNEKQLAISNFQNDFFQEQLRTAQTQIAQLTREVVELKQQTGPSCGAQCEHYAKCKLLQKDNEKLEVLRLEHIAKIANLNAQIAYLLEGSRC